MIAQWRRLSMLMPALIQLVERSGYGTHYHLSSRKRLGTQAGVAKWLRLLDCVREPELRG